RDLASGQATSLPFKNVPLVNEKQQAIGDEEEGVENTEKGLQPGSNQGEPARPRQNPNPGQKTTRHSTKRRRALANKPQDFQIRVRVVEGRQLPGNNVRPVVKVNVCGETHRTRIRRGNNPYFDEVTSSQKFPIQQKPSDCGSSQVYDSHSLRADSLMGEFKVFKSLSFLSHSVLRKWLLLSDLEDSSSGPKGYLKVSIILAGNGDEPQVNDEQDDIESNLLVPAGVTLRSASISLKVYRAEDMPQMDDAFIQTVKQVFGKDGDKKNLVDPFFEMSYSGKKLGTKIVEKNANPEWNQVMNIQAKFPFMSECIKLTVFDWDRLTKNDVIGTAFLNLSKIASSGGEIEGERSPFKIVGFLPAFGPCYINLYGSPREFSGLPDPYDELNTGKGEGVAYRGRVLVELSSKLDEKVDKRVEDISSDDILLAQKYQRKRKYSLCAVFHSACMLQEPGEPIQFEVSIGNYGNKLDTTCKPLASTTQFSYGVFDGNHYYYLPWADTKPVVILTSFWEDINHRLDSVNVLLLIAERLVRSDDLINQSHSLYSHFSLHLYSQEATDVKATVSEFEDWLERLKQLAEEPQNSFPDVIIWMMRGERRVAYARVPANRILYSTMGEEACGKFCGRTQTIFMQYPMDKDKGVKIPVQLRVNMWLGLSAHEKKFNSFAEGTFSVFAEMYENQAKVIRNWGTTGLVGRHKFSDVTGKVKLKQERFMPPRDWDWEGDWFFEPERCLLTEADAGHTEFTDEVFQNETRFPGGEWAPASEPYTDVNGEQAQSPGEMDCPPGWIWEDEWSYDVNRAVDEKGWEYGVTIPPEDKPKSWGAAEKMYHVHRRKRLVRPRRRTSDVITLTQEKRTSGDDWEYSSLIGWKFHRKERSSDMFRRRRWRRKMAPSDRMGASAIFRLEGALGVDVDEKASKADATKLFGANTPNVSCNFRCYRYHLRVYVYQAKTLCAMDKDSFSDPYVHVSFLNVSKTTEVVRSTLNPTWDQTLIFEDVEVYGDPKTIARNPPDVVMELYDSDQVGRDEALGRCTCPPIVNLNPAVAINPKLLWYPVTKKGRDAGQMLVAAELLCGHLCFQVKEGDLPLLPPVKGDSLFMVPQGIRPVVQLTAIEVLTWGLRNMKTYQLASVSSPSLVVECGVVSLVPISTHHDDSPTTVVDHRPFGRKPVVGQCTIDSLEEFRCDPYLNNNEMVMSAKSDVVITIEDRPIVRAEVSCVFEHFPLFLAHFLFQQEDTVDWWSKFYASIGEKEKCGPYLQKGYDTLQVYDCELEDVPEFCGLTDFCRTFKLQRGKMEDEDEDPSVVGEFKGSFRVYPLYEDPGMAAPPRQFRELPESGPQECLVRIYVVRCSDLQPKDNNGLCDPYIKINLGRRTVDDRENYKPNTLNPEFGRTFEMSCFLPHDKDLKIAVYDFDLLSRDEKVGETIIDLENRLLSRFSSYCGLPQTYCISGSNQWRDQLKPSQILQNLFCCLKGFFEKRLFPCTFAEANKVEHQHLGPPKERLALHVLRNQGLVPEHVETRTLYSSFRPTLSQGKIQMWVDIFPKSLGVPGPPSDIEPRKAKRYHLRTIIWNTTDVILDETSITGENMSDIYVKGWMPGMEEDKQKTDVHYRSLDGDGNFNWRFIFGFDYLPAEQLCLVSKKNRFWNLDKTEFRIPPKLNIQIWDNDKFSLDDYLGQSILDLLHLIPPAKSPEKCSMKMIPGMEGSSLSKTSKATSLFAQKSVRGWWPCLIEQDGKHVIGGKVEMTLEIVEEKEVEEKPAGKGRDEPNMNPRLESPNRPDTSFFWFTNPCKTMKFIVWRRFKWIFIISIILILVILFLAIMLYSLPNYISMKIVKPFS
uniref:Myoferlin like n=1 Tax=Gadus morhua TaxID=8049 RepID=A0A8C5BS85_GADMO